jgi:hypothetical protein
MPMLTLIEAVALVESSGNPLATRYEPALDSNPPRWLMAGLHNLMSFNPHLSYDEAVRALCTSWGKYQILGGNLYGPQINYGLDLGTFICSAAQQDMYSGIFMQISAGEIGQSIHNYVSSYTNAQGLAFAGHYNGPGAPLAYWNAVRRAAGLEILVPGQIEGV